MPTRSAPPRVRLIAGPTASGKSALALRVAEATGAVIVNADSIQLYRDLEILSARPSREDEDRVPHRLYGVAAADEAWSVGRWTRAVTPILDALREEGRPAVIVGGTGLYFRALTEGLAEIPAVPDAVRAETAATFEALGEAEFRRVLAARDPAAEARIAPGDRQRLARAFEVYSATGRALSDWQADTAPLLGPDDYEAMVVEPDRAALYARCDARFDAMVTMGALDEARALAARRLHPDLPVMKALGLRELIAWLDGTLSLPEAVELGKRETRRYAKRQLTWFRNQTGDWPRQAVAAS